MDDLVVKDDVVTPLDVHRHKRETGKSVPHPWLRGVDDRATASSPSHGRHYDQAEYDRQLREGAAAR